MLDFNINIEYTVRILNEGTDMRFGDLPLSIQTELAGLITESIEGIYMIQDTVNRATGFLDEHYGSSLYGLARWQDIKTGNHDAIKAEPLQFPLH